MTRVDYPMTNLLEEHAQQGKRYHEFLRVPDMSAGLYILLAGATDPQQPHNEDEMYYIVKGRGQFFCDGQNYRAEAGMTLYVPKLIEHRFHSIVEDLHILVFFAPAES